MDSPKWVAFRDRYNANFCPLTNNDGLTLWQKFAEECNPGFLELALNELLEKRIRQGIDTKYKPRLYEVQKVYWDIYRTNTEKSKFDGNAAKFCPTCGNSGIMVLLVADGKAMAMGKEHAKPCKDYEVRKYCCFCGKGAYQASLAKEQHQHEWSESRRGWAFKPVFGVYKNSPCDKQFPDEELKTQFSIINTDPQAWLFWAEEGARVQGEYCKRLYNNSKREESPQMTQAVSEVLR